MNKISKLAALSSFLFALALGPAAHADELGDAQNYVQKENNTISALLKQPASPSRDSQIAGVLDGYIDYDELTRRAFGEPCPPQGGDCDKLWTKLSDADKNEMKDLLRQLVQKNYRKNLIKTLDFDVAYQGAREVKGENRVITQAKNKVRVHDNTSVKIEYVVRSTGGGTFKLVDIITENSRLTTNYFRQFVSLWKKGPEKDAPDRIKTALKKAIAKP